MKSASIAFACLAGACLVPPAAAQAWPTKSVRFVVPFAPAGALDIVARTLSVRLAEQLGQPVVIDNKAGASGTIGIHEIAKAPADGHHIVIGEPAGVTIAPAVRKDLPYDPMKDLAPITTVATIPMVVAAPPGSQARTLRALIDQSKGRTDPIHYGTPGNASVQHLTGERLRLATGLPLAHAPYKGGGLAINDLMGNNLPLVMLTLPTLAGHMKSGKITGLAILAPKRDPGFPDMPTVTESGFPGFEQGIWMGIFAPAGTPRPIVDRLHAEFVKALDAPDVRDRLQSTGNTIATSTPEAFASFLRGEIAQWAKVARDARLPAN